MGGCVRWPARLFRPRCLAYTTACALSAAQGFAFALHPQAEPPAQETQPQTTALGLPPEDAHRLQASMQAHDYTAAERLLLPYAQRVPATPQTAQVLSYLGGVYFLYGDYAHAAIAWTRADAVTPLTPAVRFSLAMAYLRVGKIGWSRDTLLALEKQRPAEALYPYWLGRLDYDAQQYEPAMASFRDALRLDPRMARAHDNLGLCLFYLNRNDEAVAEYRQAIALDAATAHPSPWPYLNLAITLEFLNRNQEALDALHRALALDPGLPQAHFELGNTLEHEGQISAAIEAFAQAAKFAPTYAEPHFALARLYRKLGRKEDSEHEVAEYKRLHEAAQKNTGGK